MVPLCLGALGLAGCAGRGGVREGCAKDSDCKGARVCVDQQCVEPTGAAAARDGAPGVPSRPPGTPPYAMFGGDPRHTGRLAGAAPEKAPQPLWSLRFEGRVVGSPTVGPDGTIYAGSHDGKLHAIGTDGKPRWSLATGDRVWSTPAVAEDRTVYTGSDDDHLYAVDGATGKLKWKLRLGRCEPPIGFGPEGARCDVDGVMIGPDGTIYAGADGVYAVWPDGSLRWKFATPERVPSTPAVTADGTVYAGCLDDALYAIRPDGTKAWEYRTGADIESSPAIAADGAVVFGSDDGAVYALEPDGTLRWKVLTRAEVRATPAIGSDGTIYVGSYDGRLYAIAPTGQVLWRFAAMDRIHGPAAVAANGIILVGSQDDHLYAISPAGVLLWYLTLDDDVDAAPSLSSTGVLYTASDDQTVRAFQ